MPRGKKRRRREQTAAIPGDKGHRKAASGSPPSAQPAAVLEQVLYGVFFLVIALSFSTALQSQFTLPKVAWLRIFAPVAALVWMVRVKTGKTKPIPLFIFVAVCLLSTWWGITTVFALHQPTALDGFYGRYNGLWNQALCLSLFLFLASSSMSRGQIERFLKLFIAALVPVSVYAIAQYLDLDPISWPRGRSASTIGHPVILAAILGLTLPFTLTFLLEASTPRRKGLWATVMMISSLSVATTLARGPWIYLFG